MTLSSLLALSLVEVAVNDCCGANDDDDGVKDSDV